MNIVKILSQALILIILIIALLAIVVYRTQYIRPPEVQDNIDRAMAKSNLKGLLLSIHEKDLFGEPGEVVDEKLIRSASDFEYFSTYLADFGDAVFDGDLYCVSGTARDSSATTYNVCIPATAFALTDKNYRLLSEAIIEEITLEFESR